MHAVAAWDEQILSKFLQIYGVFDHQRPSEELPDWLYISAGVVHPDKTLRLSLRAVALTRIGRLSHDAILLASGANMYGQALRELQKALWHPKRMWEDDFGSRKHLTSL